MKASDLAKLVDRHVKLVGDVSRLHVQAGEGRVRMTSANQAGVVFTNVMEAQVGAVRACVNGEAFRGMLRAASEVNLSLRDSRLFLEGPGIRADLPTLSAGDVPKIAVDKGAGTMVGEEDVDWLRTVIERVKLKDPSADAQLSIACDGRDVVVCYYDSFHGAFTSKAGSTRMAFGFFPKDVDLLQNALSVKSKAKLHASGNNLIVLTPGESTMLPSTVSQAVAPVKVAEGAQSVAQFDSDDFRNALEGMAYLAKDGNPVRVQASPKSGLTVSIESVAGGLTRRVKSRVRRPLDAKVSFKYVHDTVRQCSGPADLLAHFEADSALRLQVDCDGYTYLTVTTD